MNRRWRKRLASSADMTQRMLEVVLPPTSDQTESGEAIALALQDELAAADGVDAGVPAPPAAGLGGHGGGEGDGSGPPAPTAPPLEQARALWQQPPSAGNAAKNQLDEVARYDEQLAWSIHERELRELSQADRDRLTRLPSLLPDSPLVRTLSDTLAGLAGVSFTRLVPQVNASIAAATEEPTSEGRARLEGRLQLYCLTERQVKGDGACQFRSLSDQLYRTPRLHGFVRECVGQQLRGHPDWYAAYVPDDFSHYCASMARPGTWGDHVTLQAAADYFGVRIAVLSSFPDSCFLELEPRQASSSRVLWLSFWAEVHYNSVYPSDDPPPPLPDDKLLGSRRLHSLLFGGAPSPTKPSPR